MESRIITNSKSVDRRAKIVIMEHLTSLVNHVITHVTDVADLQLMTVRNVWHLITFKIIQILFKVNASQTVKLVGTKTTHYKFVTNVQVVAKLATKLLQSV